MPPNAFRLGLFQDLKVVQASFFWAYRYFTYASSARLACTQKRAWGIASRRSF